MLHYEKSRYHQTETGRREDEEVLERNSGIILVLILLILAAAIVYALTSKTGYVQDDILILPI